MLVLITVAHAPHILITGFELILSAVLNVEESVSSPLSEHILGVMLKLPSYAKSTSTAWKGTSISVWVHDAFPNSMGCVVQILVNQIWNTMLPCTKHQLRTGLLNGTALRRGSQVLRSPSFRVVIPSLRISQVTKSQVLKSRYSHESLSATVVSWHVTFTSNLLWFAQISIAQPLRSISSASSS